MSTHSLVFDDTLELCDVGGVLADGGFWFETLAEGANFGEPVPVEVAISSLLRDGALTQTESDGNAEQTFLVKVCGTDSVALAQGVAALHRAVGKRTTLVWTPPDGYAPPTVFDVETSSLGSPNGFDDLAFLRNEMTVRLRIVRQPYARSATLTTEVASGIPSVGTTINTGESLTGWSTPTAVVGSTVVSPQPTMLAVDATTFIEGAGSLKATAYKVETPRYVASSLGGDFYVTVTETDLTQAISVPSGAYLSFAVKIENTTGRTYTDAYFGTTTQDTGVLETFSITSTQRGKQTYKKARESYSDTLLLSSAIVQTLANGFTRYTFRISEALSITSLEWTAKQLTPYTANILDAVRPHIWIDQVAKADSATLGQQVLKTIEVDGSARTTGAIHVAAPIDSVALGQVLAFTTPAASVPMGFRPDLRQWTTSGTTTADAAASNGSYFNALGETFGSANSPVFQAPASMFASGAHTIMARVKGTADVPAELGVEAALVIGGTVVGTPDTIDVVTTPEESGYFFLQVGTLYLPPIEVGSPSTSALVRFRFTGDSLPLDEVYAFPVTGDLTLIDCGTGTVGVNASSHLWIDAPSPEQPQGGYWRGATADRIDSLVAWDVTTIPGTHTFDPGDMLAFAASTAAQGPTVSFDYYARWLFHAPR